MSTGWLPWTRQRVGLPPGAVKPRPIETAPYYFLGIAAIDRGASSERSIGA